MMYNKPKQSKIEEKRQRMKEANEEMSLADLMGQRREVNKYLFNSDYDDMVKKSLQSRQRTERPQVTQGL